MSQQRRNIIKEEFLPQKIRVHSVELATRRKMYHESVTDIS